MRARVRGTEIFFDVDGAQFVPEGPRMVERPVLFLLHGGPGGEHSSFKTQHGVLRDVAQLIYVDHRGSGRSSPADRSTYTLDENIDDLDALRDYLGLERIAVLGSSYGGMVAQGYAIRYPNRVSNLILVATAPSHRFMDDAKRILAARGTSEQVRVCERLWSGTFESLDQLVEYYAVMAPLYSVKYDAAKVEEANRRSLRNYDQLNIGFSGFLRTYDFIPDLHRITCPTLVMAGAHDWICPPNHSRIIAEKIPRAQLKIFPQSSHSISGDEPEAYFNAVRGFLTHAPL
ncbi:MAG: alpha/beta fold hydrolase [Planctomycetaceae bacterium]|nr:alpha/beta fold hydrolase [Planctomycetaceae bacterium]